jgi:hypothetical protein
MRISLAMTGISCRLAFGRVLGKPKKEWRQQLCFTGQDFLLATICGLRCLNRAMEGDNKTEEEKLKEATEAAYQLYVKEGAEEGNETFLLSNERLPRARDLGKGLASAAQRAICDTILKRGLSLTRAAALCGFKPADVQKWRKDDEAFDQAIETAEARFMARILEELDKAKDNFGNKSPAVRMWLMEKRFAEFRNTQQIDHNVSGEVLLKAIGPESAKSLQDRRSKLALCQDAIEVEPVKQPDNSP